MRQTALHQILITGSSENGWDFLPFQKHEHGGRPCFEQPQGPAIHSQKEWTKLEHYGSFHGHSHPEFALPLIPLWSFMGAVTSHLHLIYSIASVRLLHVIPSPILVLTLFLRVSRKPQPTVHCQPPTGSIPPLHFPVLYMLFLMCVTLLGLLDPWRWRHFTSLECWYLFTYVQVVTSKVWCENLISWPNNRFFSPPTNSWRWFSMPFQR